MTSVTVEMFDYKVSSVLRFRYSVVRCVGRARKSQVFYKALRLSQHTGFLGVNSWLCILSL